MRRREARESDVALTPEQFAALLGRGTARFLWLSSVGAALGVLAGLALSVAVSYARGGAAGRLGWIDVLFAAGGGYIGYFVGKRLWFVLCATCHRLGAQERVVVRVMMPDQPGESKQPLLRCPRCEALSGRAVGKTFARRRRA